MANPGNKDLLMLIRGGKIYHRNKFLKNYEVVIDNDLISELRPLSTEPADMLLAPGDMLVSGFTDLHLHGANGKDVMDGEIDSLQVIANTLLEEGVTGFLATTMTETTEKITKALHACAQFKKNQVHGANLLGVHLEGPFLSAAYMGAQHGDYLQAPNINLLKQWQTQFPDLIKLITIAPELPDALEFIAYAHRQGIVVSIGHTAADFNMTRQGIDAGARHATHLYNAMSGIHHREPGAAAALLCDDRVTAELIVDGMHVVPEMIQFTVACKDLKQLILVTDAMRAKCLKSGMYDLGGQNVVVNDEGIARLQSNDKLAGSTLCLNQALKNMQMFTQLPLKKILPLVSTQPLKILNISDQGHIDSGQKANLVILNKELEVKATFHHGKLVYTQELVNLNE
jgi:N-acetylglucosamine-6-phosphate deacetylase